MITSEALHIAPVPYMTISFTRGMYYSTAIATINANEYAIIKPAFPHVTKFTIIIIVHAPAPFKSILKSRECAFAALTNPIQIISANPTNRPTRTATSMTITKRCFLIAIIAYFIFTFAPLAVLVGRFALVAITIKRKKTPAIIWEIGIFGTYTAAPTIANP
jgi:hypothetical protein